MVPGVKRTEEFSVDFLAFWLVYPRKVAKPLAWRSWKRQAPKLDDVLAALAWQRESAQWQEHDKIPHPSTYLMGRRWEDEKPPIVAPGASGSATRDITTGYARASAANHKGGGTDHGF